MNSLNSILVYARFLLDQLDKANIEEVWKISQITEHNVNHITFCLTDGSTARFIMKLFSCNGIPKEYRDNVLNEHDCFGQRFIDDKQANYSNRKVWSLIRTAANKCVLHNDNEFVKMIENYLDDIHKHEKEHNKVHQVGISKKDSNLKKDNNLDGDDDLDENDDLDEDDALDDDNLDKENACASILLKNPLIVATKGRPKSVSHHMNNTN
ncbi:hypothetical protein C2G38_2197079 [Gigaspora rosea]|uniref:Uncharacterized protein n=1 Tax=Gigaspora rosea TaxID=44941 RepID=A0A397UVU1_9GLOM|nr:hypothetical protein C2G38_2197079 [Gigaspora rosea]